MKVLIIEDEQPAAKKLIRLLQAVDANIQILDIISSVETAVNWLNNHEKPELIFMDVQLEDGLCFDIFDNTQIDIPVIFTTAYDQYAIKAFKVNSVDYLLKPIIEEELINAIDKFKSFHTNQSSDHIETLVKQLNPNKKERFLIKIGEHYKSIPTKKINCFYIQERCNFILTNEGKSYPIDYSLDRLEQMVNNRQFYRINRNAIINISAIRDMIAYSSSRLKVNLDGWNQQEELLVSRERVSNFKEWMDR